MKYRSHFHTKLSLKLTRLEEVLKANAVYSNRQDKCSDSPNRMMPLAGSGLKMEGDRLKIENLTALLLYNACTHLIMEICV